MTSPAAAAVDNPGWGLFTDWCAAVGACPLPATVGTVAAFFDQVPASEATLRGRLRAIRQAHRQAGQPLRIGYEPVRSAWRTGAGWLPLPEALGRCPVGGWPAAFRGRRDGFLLVAVGLAGFTRRETVGLSVSEVTWPTAPSWQAPFWLADRPVPPAECASQCPACAVTRWLRVAAVEHRWGRGSVRELLAREPVTPHGHDCAVPPPDRWRDVWQLAPAIDQYGWVTDWRPLSVRSVSAVLAVRQAASAPAATAEVEGQAGVSAPVESPLAGVDEGELWTLLDDAVAAADAANSRVATMLEDTATLMGSLSEGSESLSGE